MEWKEQIFKQIDSEAQQQIMQFARYIANVQKVKEVAEKVISELELEIKLIYIDPYDLSVNIYEGNNKLVHHLAKTLKLRFNKKFSDSFGEMTYSATLNGVKINIYEVKDIPKCRIIPKKVKRTITETRYQIICK